MDEYERTLTAPQLAEAALKQCFYLMNSQIFLNYTKILGVCHTVHMVLATPLDTVPKQPYRHLRPEDVEAIYYAYKAIADEAYTVQVDGTGTLEAVPHDSNVPQWVFNIVAEIVNLTRRE